MIEYFKFQPEQPVSKADYNQTSPLQQPEHKKQSIIPKKKSAARLRVLEPSLISSFMALDPVANDAFEERAAILEYVEGLPRAEAELLAFRRVMTAIGDER